MLGQREEFTAVPFFWSQHYDAPINYVGHAEKWDEIVVEGDIPCKGLRSTIQIPRTNLGHSHDFQRSESLQAELAMEQERRLA